MVETSNVPVTPHRWMNAIRCVPGRHDGSKPSQIPLMWVVSVPSSSMIARSWSVWKTSLPNPNRRCSVNRAVS